MLVGHPPWPTYPKPPCSLALPAFGWAGPPFWRTNVKYRKKPVVIEAFQMTRKRRLDNSEWPSWLHDAWNEHYSNAGALYPENYPKSDGMDHLMIMTLEGPLRVDWDDWIIRGVEGEIYPCKPSIFASTYEPLD